MPSYKLFYFPFRARAELIRYIFAEAGVEFEDVYINFAGEWPKHKKSMPFRQMPVLEIDGKKLAQQYTIARYLAAQFGLAGKNDWEKIEADQYCGVVEDLMIPTRNIRFNKDATAKAAELKTFLNETAPDFFEPLEEVLAKSKSGFLVGSALTYADLAFLGVFEFIESTLKDDGVALIKRYPNILKFRNKIAALPKIAKYISQRPVFEF